MQFMLKSIVSMAFLLMEKNHTHVIIIEKQSDIEMMT